VKDMHYFFVGLMKNALKKAYKRERKMAYEDFKEKSSIS